MKKDLLRLITLLLAIVMALTCAGCGNDGGKKSDAQKQSEVVIETEGDGTDTEAQLLLQQELKDCGKGKTLLYLSTYDDKGVENQCLIQMFKAMTGGTLKVQRYAEYGTMQQKLVSMHMAGESPDLYQMTNQDFPCLMYKGILTCLSDTIDFGSEVYTDKDRELFAKCAWNGGLYFLPKISGTSCMWWNRSLFEQAGIPESEMPDALYAAGKWNWNTFYDLQKRLTDKNKGIFGYGNRDEACLSYSIVNSTGEDYVTVTDNGIQSNFTSKNVTRAMNMYKKITDPNYFAGESMTPEKMFSSGKLAMFYGNVYARYNDEMVEEGVIEPIPFPKDPESDKYYLYGSIAGYAVPTGSKEPELALNFIKMLNASNYYQQQLDEIMLSQARANEKMEETFYALKNDFNYIPCLSLGIKEIHGLTWGASRDFPTSSDTWETVAAKVSPQVQSVLDKLG